MKILIIGCKGFIGNYIFYDIDCLRNYVFAIMFFATMFFATMFFAI